MSLIRDTAGIARGLMFEAAKRGEESSFVDLKGDYGHTLVVAPTGPGQSVLSDLTQAEMDAMMAWSEQQPPSAGGSVDLMAWPGWKEVVERRFSERFGAGISKPER